MLDRPFISISWTILPPDHDQLGRTLADRSELTPIAALRPGGPKNGPVVQKQIFLVLEFLFLGCSFHLSRSDKVQFNSWQQNIAGSMLDHNGHRLEFENFLVAHFLPDAQKAGLELRTCILGQIVETMLKSLMDVWLVTQWMRIFRGRLLNI